MMENNFDLKKFLVENKLTANSRTNENVTGELNEDVEVVEKEINGNIYTAERVGPKVDNDYMFQIHRGNWKDDPNSKYIGMAVAAPDQEDALQRYEILLKNPANQNYK